MANTETTNDNESIQPEGDDNLQLHLGFSRTQSAIEEVSVDDLEAITLSIGVVLHRVLGAYPNLIPLRAELLKQGSFDVRHLDNLRDYGLALGHLHNKCRRARSGPPTTLLKELFAIREHFHAEGHALIVGGVLDGASVSHYKSGNNYQGLALDVIGLSDLFLENESAVQGRIDRAKIERARLLGNQLLAALAVLDMGPSALSELKLLRHKAYTLTVRAYNEVRHAVTYIRRKTGDVDAFAPSLHSGRKKASRKGATEGAEPGNEPGNEPGTATTVQSAAGSNPAVTSTVR
jgi:hypothetical protein